MWRLWARVEVDRVETPRLEASYERCMDVKERMRLHSLLPLASRADMGDKKGRVPNTILNLVRKKMVDVIAAERQ